jgi:uncharacterized protein YbbC (DUF1343 family)
MSKAMSIILGIDTLLRDHKKYLKSRNCILITSSSCTNSQGIPVFQSLKKLIPKNLKAIWSLQHGFFIDKQDNMILSDSFFWKEWDIQIYSLYDQQLVPTADWYQGIDAIVVDIFDVGTRVYTFVNHIVMLMKYFSGKKMDWIILDRPNPVNGCQLEGNTADIQYNSIVSQLPVPMRHGLTVAEFFRYAVSFYKLDVNLEIIPVKKWQRNACHQGFWVSPSPNMPGFSTAMVYPGAVMLEGTNISEGRGTARPFEYIGASWLDNHHLLDLLAQSKLPGVHFIPVYFKPEFSKFAQTICQGVLVYPTNLAKFNSFQTYYELLRLIKKLHPESFAWKNPPYEFETRHLPIDMICGSDFIRKSLEADFPYLRIEPQLKKQIDHYRNSAASIWLYPLPDQFVISD